MKYFDFEQRSDEWHEWRSNGIGASEISVLTGTNKYSTPLKLWEEKCGFSKAKDLNFAMKHGIKNEPKVRSYLEETFDMVLRDISVQDDDNPIFRASLDGYDVDTGTLFEIKCPLNLQTLSNARNHQKVHAYWVDQVQWQIMICRPKHAYIALYDHLHDDVIVIEIFPDEKRIEEMKKLANDFWKEVQIGKPPDSMRSEHITLEDPIIRKLLEEYRDLIGQKKYVLDRLDEVKTMIEDHSQGSNLISFGNRITHVFSDDRTTYNFEAMKSDGIDLTKYMIKSPVKKSFKITLTK